MLLIHSVGRHCFTEPLAMRHIILHIEPADHMKVKKVEKVENIENVKAAGSLGRAFPACKKSCLKKALPEKGPA